jgi:8-oxo-dGTP diphosphatase
MTIIYPLVIVKLTIYADPMKRASTAATGFPPFAVTVDLVVLTVRRDALHVLLVTRGEEPFAGKLALPGGFVHADEGLERAAARELREETGLHKVPGHLEQLGSYGNPDRDPRMRVVSVAFLALAPDLPDPVAGSDAAAAHWLPVREVLGGRGRLAFDHCQILRDGVERAKAKLEYTPLATAFCPPAFTVAQLRHVYEAVWQEQLDPRNFHRKVTRTPGFLVDTGRSVNPGPGRPAALFRRGHLETLVPPLLREHNRATP